MPSKEVERDNGKTTNKTNNEEEVHVTPKHTNTNTNKLFDLKAQRIDSMSIQKVAVVSGHPQMLPEIISPWIVSLHNFLLQMCHAEYSRKKNKK